MYRIDKLFLRNWWPLAFKCDDIRAALALARNLGEVNPGVTYRVTTPSGMTVLVPARTQAPSFSHHRSTR